MGQALRAEAVLSAAARAGCGTASRPGTANIDVISDVKSVLANAGFSTGSVTVNTLVNGASGEVAVASQYSAITVTVSIPTAQVVPANLLTYLAKKAQLSQSMTIIRQG